MRLTESVSNGPPVTGYSLPSYLMVKLKLTTVPSFISPVLVTFIPPSGVASRTSVWLLIVFVLCVLGFGGIVLPGSGHTVSPKHPDGGDGYADRQFCYDASHSFSVLSDFDFSPKAVWSAAAA